MKVEYGNGMTQYGPGVHVHLTGDEVARAIDDYLLTRGAVVSGARTITVNNQRCNHGDVLDPSDFVAHNEEKLNGRGHTEKEEETMSTSKLNVRKIDELAEEIKEKAEEIPAHIDTNLIIDLCRELDDYQDKLWALEEPIED